MKKFNVPNTLTILRIFCVPVFIAVLLFMEDGAACRITSAVLFILISLTDMLDGKIARKYDLVTDFGKFLDPVADKVLVLGAMIAFVGKFDGTLQIVCVWAALCVLLRELLVTSLRLVVAGKSGKVVAASFFGKLKTTTQMTGIVIVLLEPIALTPLLSTPEFLFSYIALALMVITTLASGADYIKTYWSEL